MELTPEQKDQFPGFLDRWMSIGLSTQPADRATAELGTERAYEAAGIRPPDDYFWLGSPLAGAIADTVIGKIAKASEEAGLVPGANIPQAQKKKVVAAARKTAAANPYKTVLTPQISAVIDQAQGVLEQVLQVELPQDLLVNSLADLQLHNAAYGQHDASILCFYDFFAQVCGVQECLKLEGLNLIAQSAGWWWAYDRCAILTERPQNLSLDDRGRLHSEDNWAIKYPDGFGYCLVLGVEVPEHVVLAPEKISVAEIEAEQNVEVRRVMIEKYGQARYLMDSGAVEIARDDWGVLYRKDFKPSRRAWRAAEEPDDEPIVMVKVVNSTPEPDGSFRDYFIRVAPDLRPMGVPNAKPQELTALNAVASTFGKTGAEYAKLEVQT